MSKNYLAKVYVNYNHTINEGNTNLPQHDQDEYSSHVLKKQTVNTACKSY
jgi:hypothetical protein